MQRHCSDSALGKYIPISDVPGILPKKNGKKVSVSAVYRWLKGLRGIQLRAIQIGGTRCTSQEWLSEFFSALSAQAGLVDLSTPLEVTQADRQTEIERASARVAVMTRSR